MFKGKMVLLIAATTVIILGSSTISANCRPIENSFDGFDRPTRITTATVAEVVSSREDLEKQIAELQEQNRKLKRTVSQMKEELAALKKELSQRQKDFDWQMQQEQAMWIAENEELRTRIAELEQLLYGNAVG